ncbi:hypothetical protein [Actinoplanes auranticolor]|uniref:Uncharacterized protein n=1 Tax=Actinoplanes auranticolor TaxID=47988 RepID=A0A919S6A4_9ACTN|nr:hypothetical protein [Actinoplanes auranticolor]GIM65118.1 hypothetical protein Aau02nite_14860 [Actinoplanes auranticolor]
MQVRKWHIVPAIAVTAVLAVAVSVLVNRGTAEALVLTALVAVMTGLYLLRRHARAETLYRRDAGPRPPARSSETLGTRKGAS